MLATAAGNVLFLALAALFVAVCCALIWLWTYKALAWLTGTSTRPARVMEAHAPPRGFPVLAAGPVHAPTPTSSGGPFRVVGVDRATGEDVDLLIPAATVANAHVKAELRGIVVTEIAPVEAGDRAAAR